LKDVGKLLVWLPVLILVIGLIGWVLTLRNDVTGTVQQVDGFHEELAGVHERIDDSLEVAGTVERELNDRIAELEKSLAVANDQMQTIMGDHMGFADVLRNWERLESCPAVNDEPTAVTVIEAEADMNRLWRWLKCQMGWHQEVLCGCSSVIMCIWCLYSRRNDG
jgi:hypothetical protein